VIGQAGPPFGLNSLPADLRGARSDACCLSAKVCQRVETVDFLTPSEFFTVLPRPFGLTADAHSCDASLVSGSVPYGTTTYACFLQTPSASPAAMLSDVSRAADLAVADECRLNVLWWHYGSFGGRALEIEVPSLSLTAGLRALATQVDRLPLSALTEGLPRGQLPFADAAFALITLYGHCPSKAGLAEVRRLLAPGGTLLLAASNWWWKGRQWSGRSRADTAPTTLAYAKTLRALGFAEVCPYWVEPSLAIPRNLIPAVGRRAQQFEAIRAREWGPSPLRAVGVAAGLSAVLYPALLFVARTPSSAGRGQG
jgi:SAM-dependent methyltransferase